MPLSTPQFLTIITVPIFTGTLSCVSSVSLIFCILVYSQLKLKSVVRRILFGFCIHDCISSLAAILSVSMVPRGTSAYAVGNLVTCDIQGFMQQVGALGSILYNGSLSVYYLAVVTLNMKEKNIARKLEPWLHLIPNGFSIATAIFLAAKRQYAPLGNQHVCWIGIYPQGCLSNPDEECQRGSLKTPLYAKTLAIIPFFMTYFSVLVITIIMMFTIVKQKRKADRWRLRGRKESASYCQCCSLTFIFGLGREHNEQKANKKFPSAKFAKMSNSLKNVAIPNSSSSKSTSDKASSLLAADVENNTTAKSSTSRSGSKTDPLAFDVYKVKKQIRRESCLAKDAPIVLSSIVQKKHQPLRTKTSSSLPRRKSIVQDTSSNATGQCLLYATSFLLCWVFSATSRIYGIMGRPAPFPILLLSRFFAPLQGVFFILVYSRPHVRSLRSRNLELSWAQAFMIAFKAGGDNDSGGRSSIASNGKTILDPEGIDAPRLPEAERKRRQENVRREFQRLNNCRSSIESNGPNTEGIDAKESSSYKGRSVLQRKYSSRVSFSDDLLTQFHRDDGPNEVATKNVDNNTIAVESSVDIENVEVESTIDVESGQAKAEIDIKL